MFRVGGFSLPLFYCSRDFGDSGRRAALRSEQRDQDGDQRRVGRASRDRRRCRRLAGGIMWWI